MKPRTVSIEYAHTELRAPDYTEIVRSGIAARRLAKALRGRGIESRLAILADDKKTPIAARREAIQPILITLREEQCGPDVVIFERDLSSSLAEFLDALTIKDRTDVATRSARRQDRDGTLPCVVDICLWHLVRAGMIGCNSSVMEAVGADLSVSILDVRFSGPEMHAIELTRRSPILNRALRDSVLRIYNDAEPESESAVEGWASDICSRLDAGGSNA